MFSRIRCISFCLISLFVTQPIWAINVYTCPDISKSVKIGGCPSDDELKRMFNATCGWDDTENDNPHAKGVCKNYSLFRKAKNTALWESKDGEYSGYLSCDKKESEIKATKLVKISTTLKKQINRVICTYEGGSELVLRTFEFCEIAGAKLLGR
ncbi:MAG: hypothetical protein GY694_07645, partial [Gammaproteobacteria bacterium]|nr:hypothetical protein [Gammaproteobacteria bacterium]